MIIFSYDFNTIIKKISILYLQFLQNIYYLNINFFNYGTVKLFN